MALLPGKGGGGGGGGGTPLYELYRYVPLWRVWFSSSFFLGSGIKIRDFWSRTGYHFEVFVFEVGLCFRGESSFSRGLYFRGGLCFRGGLRFPGGSSFSRDLCFREVFVFEGGLRFRGVFVFEGVFVFQGGGGGGLCFRRGFRFRAGLRLRGVFGLRFLGTQFSKRNRDFDP